LIIYDRGCGASSWLLCISFTQILRLLFLQRVINETDPAISENPEQVKVCSVGLRRMDFTCLLYLVSNSTAFVLSFLQTLVFCTGQIYYELLLEREKRGTSDVALVRLEQIAPFAFDRIAKNAKKYSNAEIIWAQQEPK
jgi:2-oxoglutarate dehydrogenase complex dehydrogenase (E1) component-like enzyme